MQVDPTDGAVGEPAPSPDGQRLSEQILVHFYRATVGHADAWRQRMDATTNWAAGTTAAMISVTFSAAAPHFVLLLGLAFDTMFLLMESRRYQVYDLWRRRVHWMNRYFILPALSESIAPKPAVRQEKLEELARDLGRTVPHLSLTHAIGYRIQRNYGYLFTVALVAWALKLGADPAGVSTLADLAERARVGIVPGPTVMALVAAYVVGAAGLAIAAPSEQMMEWTQRPSRLRRWRDRRRPPPGSELEGDQIPPLPLDI